MGALKTSMTSEESKGKKDCNTKTKCSFVSILHLAFFRLIVQNSVARHLYPYKRE